MKKQMVEITNELRNQWAAQCEVRGWTVTRFGEMVNISDSYMGRILNGKVPAVSTTIFDAIQTAVTSAEPPSPRRLEHDVMTQRAIRILISVMKQPGFSADEAIKKLAESDIHVGYRQIGEAVRTLTSLPAALPEQLRKRQRVLVAKLDIRLPLRLPAPAPAPAPEQPAPEKEKTRRRCSRGTEWDVEEVRTMAGVYQRLCRLMVERRYFQISWNRAGHLISALLLQHGIDRSGRALECQRHLYFLGLSKKAGLTQPWPWTVEGLAAAPDIDPEGPALTKELDALVGGQLALPLPLPLPLPQASNGASLSMVKEALTRLPGFTLALIDCAAGNFAITPQGVEKAK